MTYGPEADRPLGCPSTLPPGEAESAHVTSRRVHRSRLGELDLPGTHRHGHRGSVLLPAAARSRDPERPRDTGSGGGRHHARSRTPERAGRRRHHIDGRGHERAPGTRTGARVVPRPGGLRLPPRWRRPSADQTGRSGPAGTTSSRAACWRACRRPACSSATRSCRRARLRPGDRARRHPARADRLRLLSVRMVVRPAARCRAPDARRADPGERGRLHAA